MTAASEQPRVLSVEDEQLIALDPGNSLARLGYDVTAIAADEPSAIELAASTEPDIILMDIGLTGERDGIAAAHQIRRELDIPVLFVTGHTDPDTLARATDASPLGYLTKPFRPDELNATPAVALHQHRRTREWLSEYGSLTTLLASLAEGVIATGIEGNVRCLNPVAQSMTGWTQEEATGHPVESIGNMLTVSRECVEICQLRQALLTGEPTGRQQFLLLSRDGREIPIEAAASPIHDKQNGIAGAVALFGDISARKQSEAERERLMAELERSNRELAEYSYTVSHDLQVPLRTMRMFAEVLELRSRGSLDKEQGELLAGIKQAAEGMQQLISSLLRFSQAGYGPVRRERVQMKSLLDRVRFTLGSMIAETQATVEAGVLPVIEADAVQIEQLFRNLIGNAIKYRRPDIAPHIVITADSSAVSWNFSVEDNGEGVPAEYADTIFKPLKRLHGTDMPGAGPGLALSKAIVERHGGQIRVEPSATGPGARFRFTLERPGSHARKV